ncbi:MAG: hypothetical protein JWR05_2193 [Mucilaginibacter sp.]|nr:hypothetical protein [Mucilaginibacter sp.]
MDKITKELSSKILTLGADPKNHRGGIGAVIELYTTFFEDFNFIPTYRPYGNNIKKSIFFVKQTFALIKELNSNKNIQIVHIHGSHSGSFYRKLISFFIAKKVFCKTVIYHLHSSSFDLFYMRSGGFSKKLINYVINNSDKIVCLSPWWKNFYSTNFNCKAIEIINNVVNEPLEINSLHTEPINYPLNFLFLGRIGDRKGIFDFIDIVCKEKASLLGRFKLYIGGDGEIERLNKVINENHLGDIVEYIGWVTNKEKHQYLKKSHVYVLPSYNEGLPISILEAMSYGLPILSTDIGGIPEVLENGVNGFIFKPGDKAALEHSVKYLLDDPEKLIELGKGSLGKIKPYLPNAVATQLIELYEPLLK